LVEAVQVPDDCVQNYLRTHCVIGNWRQCELRCSCIYGNLMMSARVQLFVYGSLKCGRKHHSELRGAPLVASVATVPKYELLNLGAYPALSVGSEVVHGELYAVESDTLILLDDFEGEAYRRAEVELEDGTRAQAYFLRDPGEFPKVPGGRW
jgi:gamma-glutamylcyclotransferase (GGCT)/AIG2-like uncharacterized protein YtfP